MNWCLYVWWCFDNSWSNLQIKSTGQDFSKRRVTVLDNDGSQPQQVWDTNMCKHDVYNSENFVNANFTNADDNADSLIRLHLLLHLPWRWINNAKTRKKKWMNEWMKITIIMQKNLTGWSKALPWSLSYIRTLKTPQIHLYVNPIWRDWMCCFS